MKPLPDLVTPHSPLRPPAGSISLALGSGGARGIAHIVLLEVLDELGLRPRLIVGASMGAIIGAAYAAGFSGTALRQHVFQTLRRRQFVLARLLEARVGRFADILTRGLANPVMVDAERMLGFFWPDGMPERFEDLGIPLKVVVTDFFAHDELVIDSGDLASAVAGSMAIPGLVRPVPRDGRMLIDGGAVNPLPYDLAADEDTIVIASDVTGGPVSPTTGIPSPFEAMFGAAQIMQIAITTKMLKARPPDLLVRLPINEFRALDFFRFAQILRAAEDMKDELKREIEAALTRRASVRGS